MTSSVDTTMRNGRPIISICVPTFNRAACLENLLKNLAELRVAHGDAVEICISNNHSSDNTSQVIESWCAKLVIKVITQSENIGASKNAFAVVKEATGKWVMILGDDDALIPSNFAKLMVLLKTVDEGDWILAGVADASGNERYLGDLDAGRYSAKAFRRIVLQTGLYPYGFIGMHIFPSVLQKEFAGLTIAQAQPWPHLALLLRHLQVGHFQVFTSPIVEQAAGGAELFWDMGDWAHINLRKMNIVAEARTVIKNFRWFFDFLLARELYSSTNLRILVLWKVLEPAGFFRNAFREHISRYALLGPLAFLAVFHSIFLLVLYITPSCVLPFILRLAGKQSSISTYNVNRQEKADFNGVDRGI